MAILFLDSSAIVKLYVIEQGSQWIKATLDPTAGNVCYISVLSGSEVTSAIVRRRRVGSLTAPTASKAIDEFIDDWRYLFNHIAVDERLIENSMKLAQARELRGYDAVQLAAAFALRERYKNTSPNVTFVSADDELNTAASAEGLQVENPNAHP